MLFAPWTTYVQHRHDEIEESYISLAGAWSENDNAVYAPGSLIFLIALRNIIELQWVSVNPACWPMPGLAPLERLSTPEFRFSKLPRRQI